MMNLVNMVRGMAQDEPARLLLQRWEHDEGTLTLWRASSNFVYRFEASGKGRYLRFVHEKDNTLENVAAELEYVRYLIDAGYPAAAPVRSMRGGCIETAETAHGRYYGVVFEEAEGRSLPLEEMSDEHLLRWGEALAKLHQLSEAYEPCEAVRGSWRDALDLAAASLEHSPQDRLLLLELERLLSELSELAAGPDAFGVIHYDFQPDNVFYDDHLMRFTIIDFDDAIVHWHAMDIASAAADLLDEVDAVSARKLERFLTGYRSVRPLDSRCEELLPVFRRFANFYTLARLLRSLDSFEADTAPEWAATLYDKLRKACDRIRTRLRPAVELRPVDAGNWYACTQIEVTEEQKNIFPVPLVYWLAESAYCGMTPLAIYAASRLVGLAVYAADPDDGSYWVMAFVIDRRYQSLGLGRAAMEELLRHMKEKHGCDRIRLGHRPENERAARLYASLDFREIERNDREIVRELS
ncbi:GNAT family N-acetyltransferase [Paenibacillus soyae]|uniref:Bifunctional AAC/APH n=1 Tax=Paenibacillus soyae TaxID=2969249 RepID=A0A9X2MS88_9BACL|nr:GNAT family N-acetyltransferase [Paenibacillus soyae]MCR2805931.1 GNAT family N-acetyltransferase [Paenibacillus soyae]